LPAEADEKLVKFPGSFETQQACVRFAELLISKREFECLEEQVVVGPVLFG
jgi:hypothetical protein